MIGVVAALLTLLANLGVASACGLTGYQPEVPTALKK
ncbi:cyclic lactone autoinducer peptide [Heliobacterium undosum]|uniref:Cyclic lactone autoinducer peptide n=1 Tax=Heliomicrobium undosum TaxID=121734 RepID=A0A845L3F9_9FIRM|nr:cyclic lactone autoinducer peptide [Heliomicrobium undosum]